MKTSMYPNVMLRIKIIALILPVLLLGCTAINLMTAQKEYPTSISFNSATCELSLSGAIDNKLVSLFQQTLQTDPSISNCKEVKVVLSSTGGNVYPAFNLGNMIRAKNFSTQIAQNAICVSACNIVYIGGVKRYMAQSSPSTKVGFHQMISLNGGNDKCIDIYDNSDVASSYRAYIKKMLAQRPADFYMENVSKVSCRSVKYYTSEELKESGIVTNTY